MAKKLTNKQKVLRALWGKPLTAYEVGKRTKLGLWAARDALYALKEEGKVTVVGTRQENRLGRPSYEYTTV